MAPDGTRADTVNQGNIIHIIDAANPYEGAHDKACVKELQVDAANKRVKIDLGQVDDCNAVYTLTHILCFRWKWTNSIC